MMDTPDEQTQQSPSSQRIVPPEWSHALALIAQSPIWDGEQIAKSAYMDAAEHYNSYDELPRDLKATYKRAERALEVA